MADLDVKAIRARVEAATPGPWVALPCDWPDRCDGIRAPDEGERIVETDSGIYPPTLSDARFIAEARTDVPALLDEVERLRLVLIRARGALSISDCCDHAGNCCAEWCRACQEGRDGQEKRAAVLADIDDLRIGEG